MEQFKTCVIQKADKRYTGSKTTERNMGQLDEIDARQILGVNYRTERQTENIEGRTAEKSCGIQVVATFVTRIT